MMNKKYIYQYLLFPLLACLLVGAAGCSGEVTEGDGQPSPDGNTHITFTTRGIVTESPIENGVVTDYDAFDSYIQSLRIIGFCNGEMQYNQLFKAVESGDAKAWTLVNDEIDITDILSSPVGGTYTFYFIANEEGHTVAGSNELLTDKLKDTDQTLTPSVLDGMGVNFSVDEITGSTPIVMTQKQSFLIRLGQTNSMGKVELVRALAKAQLRIRKEASNTTNYSVGNLMNIYDVGKIHSSYPLMEGGTLQERGYLSDTVAPLEESSEERPNDGYTYFYISNPLYIPEVTPANRDDAIMIYADILQSQSGRYYFPLGDHSDNFSMKRNTSYTTTVTFQHVVSLPTLDYKTETWKTKEISVPPFN